VSVRAVEVEAGHQVSEQFFNELTKREEGRQLCQAQVRVAFGCSIASRLLSCVDVALVRRIPFCVCAAMAVH
jgi:hypothetical protein